MQSPVRVPAYAGVVTEALETRPVGANVTMTPAGLVGSPGFLQAFRLGVMPSIAAFAALALNTGRTCFTRAGAALGGALDGTTGATGAVAVGIEIAGADSGCTRGAATTNSGERSGCTKPPVTTPTRNAMTMALPPASIHARFGRVLQNEG